MTPEEIMIANETREHFSKALSKLNERQQDIIFARLEGLTYREIAEIHNLSKSRVQQIELHGMRKIKQPHNHLSAAMIADLQQTQ